MYTAFTPVSQDNTSTYLSYDKLTKIDKRQQIVEKTTVSATSTEQQSNAKYQAKTGLQLFN